MKIARSLNLPALRMLACILLSALLSAACARGGIGWLLGFGMLVPWLRVLDTRQSMAGALLSGWLMSLAFTAAVFAWFGMAIGSYTQVGPATGLAVLLVAAPLFQPQFVVFALVRFLVGRKHGASVRALAAAAAWVATEWLIPKMLGDSLGHGMYASRVLRQVADLGGVAGITLLLLLANEGLAVALARRTGGWRAIRWPLAFAAAVPVAMSVYGYVALASLPPPTGPVLRVGMVQSNQVDYERKRQEKGSHAVVQDVLDIHFAMSYDAVERQHADAVLWSETVYPTTFTKPKSEAGAQFDGEILSIVRSAGVPFVFGTYDRDASGEYNAAAVVVPANQYIGFYRKTRLFPFTEYVPGWIDGPLLRQWLPWTGGWKPGNGARVFPLRLADGREIPVMPSICLDDVDTALAIAGARLGAQAILTLSNDAWFTPYPQGAELHQTVAAFRSIETRMPQFRVTSNGYSAAIDLTGTVTAGSRMGEQTLVIGALPTPVPPRTLVVLWGDWVGAAGCGFLAWLLLRWAMATWSQRRGAPSGDSIAMVFPIRVSVLPPTARGVAGALHGLACASLLVMGAAMLFNDSLRGNPLAQIRAFATYVLAPELAAWCILLAYSARLFIEEGQLVLQRGRQRMALALADIAAVVPWQLPVPGNGATLLLTSAKPWRFGIAMVHPQRLAHALSHGDRTAASAAQPLAARYAQVRLAIRRGHLDRFWVKFIVFPCLLALPAFHLHQNIAYGGGLGEYYTFGLRPYLTTLALWCAAWTIGVSLCAAALRAAIEMGTVATLLIRPTHAVAVRQSLESTGRLLLFVGLPAWLLVQAL